MCIETVEKKRNFLFLQGPLSPLFYRLGSRLKAEGFAVYRINFNVGDWLHWHGENCFSFRGGIEDWPDFIEKFIVDYSITDLVLHSDRRIYHRRAIEIAKRRDLYIAVTELGILRPGWLTIEVDGLGLQSHFPVDPEYLLQQAEILTEVENARKFSYPYYQMAFWDVSYNLINYFLFWRYPRYQRHTPYNPIPEYFYAALRLINEKKAAKHAEKVIKKLIVSQALYYVFPLQLNGDFQIRDYSPYKGMAEAIEVVLKSFSQHAPAQAHLLVKQHPLDPGLDKLEMVTLGLSEKLGIEDRVHYIDGGNLEGCYQYSQGAVMVNSSAALEAIDQGLSVKTLAPAIYDIPGMTFQGELDDFWVTGFRPRQEIVMAFVKVLKHSTQVPGALYGKAAIESAANAMAGKVIQKQLNQPAGYVEVPPRLSGNEGWFNP